MDMLSPGVYPQETDFSSFIRAQSTSVLGLVGVFEKGPVGVATRVASLEEAKSKFGTYLDGHQGMLALNAFFTNGGNLAEVVRVTHLTDGVSTGVAATITVVDRESETPVDTLKVSASSEGAWGNDLSVEVTASVAYPSTGFNLIVKTDAGVTLETFKDLLIGSANEASDDYVERKINGVSAYVVVEDLFSATAANDNRPAVGSSALATGADGLTSLAASDYVAGLEALDEVSVNSLAVPGETDSTVAAALITKAELHGCFAILEVIQGDTVAEMATYRDTLTIDSSYGGLYGPWLDEKHPVTNRAIKLSPAGVVAGIFARNDAQGAVWTAPAGITRGVVRGVTGAELRLSRADNGTLQEKGINPITVVAGTLVVAGQKTLQLRASATDRVNVRRLMSYIETSVTDEAQSLVFEANDKTTWEAFKRRVNPFLQKIKDARGITDFLVVCDSTINTAEVIAQSIMKARILVQPVKTAEFIAIEFSIAPEGASFTEV